jgi:hypothetical protein
LAIIHICDKMNSMEKDILYKEDGSAIELKINKEELRKIISDLLDIQIVKGAYHEVYLIFAGSTVLIDFNNDYPSIECKSFFDEKCADTDCGCGPDKICLCHASKA